MQPEFTEEHMKWLWKNVWRRGAGTHAYLSVRKEGRWEEHPILNDPASLRQYLPNVPQDASDYYFSPLTFDGPRNNKHAAASSVLYADLDGVGFAVPHLKPHWIWETSPGSTQALWYLTEFVERAEHSSLNKALTYATGADRGGWHGSKLLRVPHTPNGKRGVSGSDWPRFNDQPSYDYSTVLEKLSPWYQRVEDGPDTTTIPEFVGRSTSYEEWLKLLEDMRLWIPKYTLHLLLTPSKRVYDRSTLIWRTACELRDAGITAEVSFFLIRGADWNKWSNEPRRLWRDVEKAYR